MKNKGTEVSLVLVGLIALALSAIAATPVSAQLNATVSIGNISLAPGSTGTLPINITDAPNNVSSAQVDLTYDPTVVTVVGVGNSDFKSDTYGAFISNTNEPGKVRMIGYQYGDPTDSTTTSLATPITFAEVTVKAVGSPGDNTSLHLESDLPVLMGTGSPYEVGNEDGWASIIGAVPVYNTFGMIALIGLLAIVLAVTVRRR